MNSIGMGMSNNPSYYGGMGNNDYGNKSNVYQFNNNGNQYQQTGIGMRRENDDMDRKFSMVNNFFIIYIFLDFRYY